MAGRSPNHSALDGGSMPWSRIDDAAMLRASFEIALEGFVFDCWNFLRE